jgi:putative colanic acid biosynthesis acetyltransferase WcaF
MPSPYLYMKVSLAAYNNSWYSPGRSALTRIVWFYVNAIVFNSSLFPFSSIKASLLRLFGATVGQGVTIKPRVNIKYPWFLTIGNYVWIGENVWLDSLTKITIGDNCCLSQGALLLTGNHNYRKSTFDLMLKEILLEDGVWIGAQSTVCPGVTCGTHAVLTVGSVASANLESYKIYRGNPAVAVKERIIV